MGDSAILATLPKLNDSNWFEWKKEAETFLLLAGLDGTIDAEEVPTGAKAVEWTMKDHKTYTYLFFLIKPNYHMPIIDIKSSHEAWKKLIAEYKKDSSRKHGKRKPGCPCEWIGEKGTSKFSW